MTHAEETENFLSNDSECEFCGEDMQGYKFEKCSACEGVFCSKECLADHLKPDASPGCGGGRE